MGGVLVVGGAIEAYFGTAWLIVGHALGATGALVGGTTIATFGALGFLIAYPRKLEQKTRAVAKVIPLVLLDRVGQEMSRAHGKCALPRVIPLGPVGSSTLPDGADPVSMSRPPPRIAVARGNAARVSFRHR